MSEHPDTQPPERERPTLQPRIWIGSLADYNAGWLHGDWVDAAVEDDELVDAAQRILSNSREPVAEEWGIFDSDEFGDFRINDYQDLGTVATVARGIVKHGPAFAAWAELVGGDRERLAQFADAFLGEYGAAADWAREVLEDQALEAELDRAIPDSLRPYVSIDHSAFVRDAQLGGDIDVVAAPDGRVWIFSALV